MAEDVNVEYYYVILLLSSPQHAGIYVEGRLQANFSPR